MERLARLAAGVCLALLASACNEAQPVAPIVPSPIPPPAPSLTVSGVVYESLAAGRRPLAGVGIDISVEYQSWPPTTTTDAEGHYQVSGLSGQNLKLIATKAGYSQPCRAPIALATNNVLDIYLVSNEVLSTTGVPSAMPILEPTLSGLVFERTPQGLRPIPAAALVLDFSGGLGWAPSAATKSDAMGRYILCGVTDIGFGLLIYASAPGYVPAEIPVDVRVTRGDVELKRK